MMHEFHTNSRHFRPGRPGRGPKGGPHNCVFHLKCCHLVSSPRGSLQTGGYFAVQYASHSPEVSTITGALHIDAVVSIYETAHRNTEYPMLRRAGEESTGNRARLDAGRKQFLEVTVGMLIRRVAESAYDSQWPLPPSGGHFKGRRAFSETVKPAQQNHWH